MPNELKLDIKGLHCPTCAEKIRKKVLKIENVECAEIDISTGSMYVGHKSDNINLLIEEISKLASRIEPGVTFDIKDSIILTNEYFDADTERKIWAVPAIRIAASVALLIIGMLVGNENSKTVLCLCAYLLAGYDIFF